MRFIWVSSVIEEKNDERKRFKGEYVPTAQEGDFFLQDWNLFMSMIVILVTEQEKRSSAKKIERVLES
ncbi:hypothetical protein M3182_18560 [Mesobacillus maritimus]|uniref:hypothetical protein n=1 Tax=Mesobacillus maritimus TaxID=1643336 RepID=UPI00203FA53B|nr:hypothetical protein [Mesobacillus maritimus]MCM3587739.1 hypothetical protein [Mesobacillus maritimus]